MIRRKPKAISAFELRRLSVVLFVSTQRQGSSKYLLKKEINTALRNGHWVPVVRIQKQTSQILEHTVTYRKRIERNYALGIWLHDQVPSRAQVVQQLLQI